jgi:hypothetical protein
VAIETSGVEFVLYAGRQGEFADPQAGARTGDPLRPGAHPVRGCRVHRRVVEGTVGPGDARSVPDNHLAWFVLVVVEKMDLWPF